MNNKLHSLHKALWMAGALLVMSSACSEEDSTASSAAGTVYNLCLEQAQNIFSKSEPYCNVIIAKNTEGGDPFKTDLNMGFTMAQASGQDVTAQVSINKDTLQQSIAKVGTSRIYDIYKDAKIVPESYYTLSGNELTLKKGSTRSNGIQLTVNTDKLMEDLINSEDTMATYILPVSLQNVSAYTLDSKRHTVMYVFNLKEPKVDPEYTPDGKGVSDDDEQDGYKLLWHDEFNGSGAPNSEMWRFEEGFQRNEEDQWYSRDNATMAGNALVITARKQQVANPNYNPNATGGNAWKQTRQYAEYTSACIVAQPKYAFKYGRMIVRAKIPVTKGAWPAIWSTGETYEWPLNGEIDMMEFYKEKIHANVAWGGWSRWSASWNSKDKDLSYFTGKDANWADKYHIWRMDWDENYIRIYLDDELLNETDLNTTNNHGDHGAGAGGNINPYRTVGQLMMLNLAVGGINGRPIDDSKFPLTYSIDYIRVYQKK